MQNPMVNLIVLAQFEEYIILEDAYCHSKCRLL